MELTASFVEQLQHFAPVFTTPTFQTFSEIVTGWVLSHRHRYVTEVIFAGGNVGNGHWCRFHRFFSQAAWDMDTLALFLAKLVGTILAPGSTLFWAVDDTLCRKRGLTLYGAGMHYDPLISSRAKPLVSWGHDWVVLCLIIVKPFWAPTKVFALPIAVRLYRNRQGLTKGKKSRGRASKPKPNPDHRTRPELARELIDLVAQWYPDDEIILTGDSAYGGKSISLICRPTFISSAMFIPRVRFTSVPRSRRWGARERLERKGTVCPAWPSGPGFSPAVDSTQIQPVRTACDARRQNYEGSLLQGRWRPRVDDCIGARLGGKRPDQMFYCTKLDWNARQILTAYSYRWAIECTFENCKQLLGLEDPANRVPKAVERTAPMALLLYSIGRGVVPHDRSSIRSLSGPAVVSAEAGTFIC